MSTSSPLSDYDFSEEPPKQSTPVPQYDFTPDVEKPASLAEKLQRQGGVLGGFVTLSLFLVKIGGPLLKLGLIGKHLVTFGSMIVFAWVRAQYAGWPMAIGAVLMIFTHECGHALAAKRFKLPYAGMLFIPFLGGVVFHKPGNTTVVQDAFIGIMGPVVGTIYGIICHLIYAITGQWFWLQLAQWTYLVNLVNLVAWFAPFDGHWILAVFAKRSGANKTERWKYALAWAGLTLFLVVFSVWTGNHLHEIMPVRR